MGEYITKNLENKIIDIISPLGYELVDVETRKEYGQVYITVYIDQLQTGVSLDDCEKVHYALDAMVEESELNNGNPYVFEISSPGLDRPFVKQKDFERNYGRDVEVKLYAPLKGKKLYTGKLLNRTENYIEIEKDEVVLKIETNKIALVRQLIKFE